MTRQQAMAQQLRANRRNYDALYGVTEMELMQETFAEHGEKVAA